MTRTAKNHEALSALPAAGPDPNAAREITRAVDPLAWTYLRLSPEGRDERALQVRHVVDLLTQDGASRPAVSTMRDRLVNTLVAPLQLALFVAENGAVVYEQHLPEEAPEDRAGYSAPADVLPLLACDQDRPPFVSVVIDRSGADLCFSAGGPAEDDHEQVNGPDDEIEQNAPGGWASLSQSRFQRRAVDSWQHNAAAVAHRVRQRATAVHAQTIVVAGDDSAVKLFLDRLAVGPDTLIHHVAGSRAATGSIQDQKAWLARALREVAATQTDRLMETFHERLDGSGLAVEGVRETISALAAGRVAVLLVDPASLHRPTWFGPRGTDVYLDRERAVLSGLPVRSARLVDVAVRSALSSSGRVRIVPTGDASPAEGIGALCRFGG